MCAILENPEELQSLGFVPELSDLFSSDEPRDTWQRDTEPQDFYFTIERD